MGSLRGFTKFWAFTGFRTIAWIRSKGKTCAYCMALNRRSP